jgi:hypothetical protein
MTFGTRLLCVFYAAVALAAFYGTWSENLAYFGPGAHGGGSFLPDLKVNAASRSFAIDLGLFLLAAAVWMVREARKVGVRFVWIYIVLSFAIAISVTFPLFLLARELRLASDRPVPVVAPVVRALDLVGLVALTAASVAFGLWLH